VPPREPAHLRRLALLWLLVSVVATPLAVVFVGPLMGPGSASDEALGQGVDNTVLLGVAVPVMALVLVFLVYALLSFRADGAAAAPALRGDRRVQIAWIMTSVLITVFLASYGTARLLSDGSGGGQGADPLARPAGAVLPVQVIAQQWAFTYRYPTYGGVETSRLELPADQTIAFHVTSLDVIHSFWAYQLGVKADATPGFDNVAYATTRGPTSFDIRCAELCGTWHGGMYATGHVVPGAQFRRWVVQQKQYFKPVARYLPPYARSYFPDPQRRGG
jgi:cytochrome c oxidase subunit 2